METENQDGHSMPIDPSQARTTEVRNDGKRGRDANANAVTHRVPVAPRAKEPIIPRLHSDFPVSGGDSLSIRKLEDSIAVRRSTQLRCIVPEQAWSIPFD